MEEIKIVEYNPSLASGVADMWNKSAEGWNGMDTTRTAEMVVREHENSHHLNVYLAALGDEIIGYCSLDKFTQDEGALYVNTLNVRPDYHGRKVGKMLVLACVQKTIELGWPRVDLFTWPGNTKAVPLYKKCGFFWEKREDTTHLMNYIPTVLKTEAICDYFQDADWYNDSKRLIEVKPDGKKENGFDYLEYLWEHSGRLLRVEFERTGRGMRLIETDDYMICASIENHELVFGLDYTITYSIVNKTGKPLKVQLNGKNDKNISFSMEHSVEVTDKAELGGRFFVGAVTEEQKPGRTHPTVTTEVIINGGKALFKTGVLPVYPLVMNLHVPGHECHLHTESVCILEMENKFKQDAVFTFKMKDDEGVRFQTPNHTVQMGPGERKTLKLTYLLSKFTYYSENLDITADLVTGTTLSFPKQLSKAFRGRTGVLSCVTEDFCEMMNGPFLVHFNKHDNSMWSGRIHGDQYNPYWIFPRIGHPFSSELSNKKADTIECFREVDSIVMKAVYSMNDFPSLSLTVMVQLEASGILKRWYEVQNISELPTAKEVWLSDTFRQDLFKGVIPYDHDFVYTGVENEWMPTLWDSDRITENWVFAKGDTVTRGVCWEKDQRVKFDNWCMFFEYNLGHLAPGQKVVTNPVTIAVGLFERWQDFRAYALKKDIKDIPGTTYHTALEINQGNPFVEEDFEVSLKEYRNLGEPPALSVCKGSAANPDIVTATVQNGSITRQYQSVIFRKSNKEVQLGKHVKEGKKVVWASNESLCIKASADFSYTLYSLEYEGNEWFDSSFPAPGMKSWWNPWLGGITVNIGGLSAASMLEENREAELVSLKDKMGNTWQGIRMTVKVDKNERLKGLVLKFHYLLLPGAPVLCSFVTIHQNTGQHFPWQFIEQELFFKADSEITNNWVHVSDEEGAMIRMSAGKGQHFTKTAEPILIESPNRKEKLLVYMNPDYQKIEAGVNNSLLMAFTGLHREMRDKETISIPPLFLVFTDKYLPAGWLKDLKNIRFEIEE